MGGYLFKMEIVMHVLVVSREDDAHADAVVKQLHKADVPIFRWNTEKSHEYEICIDIHDGVITNPKNNRSLKLSEVTAVYLRRRSYPDISFSTHEEEDFAQREWKKMYTTLLAYLDCLPVRWLNSPSSIEYASCKLRQQRIALNCGFFVPETLYTNVGAIVNRKYSSSRYVYKAFDGGVLSEGSCNGVYTTPFDQPLNSDYVQSLSVCPGIFQPYVDKKVN
jgi:hypothetical protein